MKNKTLTLLLLATLACAAAQAETSKPAARVRINGKDLSTAEIADLQARLGSQIASGAYWYDAKCGAFGQEGGPTLGFIAAGLPVKGQLKADASGGGTG